jgi:hypothetical protein
VERDPGGARGRTSHRLRWRIGNARSVGAKIQFENLDWRRSGSRSSARDWRRTRAVERFVPHFSGDDKSAEGRIVGSND